jgi:competence protein ComEC
MRPMFTRFRAYQLGSPGSSFSYFADGRFTIFEGRFTEVNRLSIASEMKICGVSVADELHITSWDRDHCASGELEELLLTFQPTRIECPGYDPHTDNGHACLEIVNAWAARKRSNRPTSLQFVTPQYIESLEKPDALAFRNVLYNPKWIDPDCGNNNSTVKFFRGGSFNVLSLGDVECSNISSRLRRCTFLKRETDVMILAHHGADNGFTTKKFLSRIDPTIAICSSDFDNKYDHPRDEIRGLLYDQGARLFTTKTGDVVIQSIGDHVGDYQVINLKANSTEISSHCTFRSKKAKLLSQNADTVRQLYHPTPNYRSIGR